MCEGKVECMEGIGSVEGWGDSNDCEGKSCRVEEGQSDTHDRVGWWGPMGARVPRQDMLVHVS